jgi:hypothetical protein
MTHIPTNLCFVFHNHRESKPRVFTVEGEEDFLLVASQFASPAREDDKFWDRFLTQLSVRMVDLTKVYWRYTTFRRRTAWIPEVCSVGLSKTKTGDSKSLTHTRWSGERG